MLTIISALDRCHTCDFIAQLYLATKSPDATAHVAIVTNRITGFLCSLTRCCCCCCC